MKSTVDNIEKSVIKEYRTKWGLTIRLITGFSEDVSVFNCVEYHVGEEPGKFGYKREETMFDAWLAGFLHANVLFKKLVKETL